MFLLEDDQQQLNSICESLREQAQAKAVLLVNGNGQLLASLGDVASLDTTSMASLMAGAAAATGGLAALLGEDDFPTQYFEGTRDHLYTVKPTAEWIVGVIFDARSSLGLVRLRVKRAVSALVPLYTTLSERVDEAGELAIFGDMSDDDIDHLFGDSF